MTRTHKQERTDDHQARTAIMQTMARTQNLPEIDRLIADYPTMRDIEDTLMHLLASPLPTWEPIIIEEYAHETI